LTVEVGETLRVESAAQWRDWLTRHHADRREIWLVNDRKGPDQRTLGYEEVLDEATCFGWVDGMVRRLDEAHFLIRWTPRRPKSNWTPGNRERARRLFSSLRMTEAGVAALPPELRAELVRAALDIM
jgi:uncharacterized protein YdeI (YjbR/CyaY-like superfamily)